eukprot:CAMPEP_0117683228 /NCGR_PEP_ID=MMETSP0804-20121206/20246_1 /TAXON_ID=1074897 /ORGANISM="Tetraselmis astigmatica, Strain CCMP880" /LENGTH=32 /DNA_ID= /DNA_START= /DNA_END= /DNA_ORIENTATION=
MKREGGGKGSWEAKGMRGRGQGKGIWQGGAST